MPSGFFVTFEGGEGAGKSTQIARLRQRLERAGVDVVATREPGGSPKAERLRRAILAGAGRAFGPFAEALMFSAARMDHLDALIRPALARGAVVLCDRFADSTRVYQGVLGAADPALVARLEDVVLDGTVPDLTFVLDISVEVGMRRAAQRRRGQGEAADRFEAEERPYHEGLRRAFRTLAEQEPSRCVLIDGERDADLVEAEIWRVMQRRLPDRLLEAARNHVA
jgi:dTMP kinase